VPVGGMGAISDALATAARTAGVEIHTSAEVERIDADAKSAEVRTTSGERYRARLVLCGAAPTVLDALLGRNATSSSPEGAQVKLNMIVGRLPRLACNVDPRDAFAGTLHVPVRPTATPSATRRSSDRSCASGAPTA
jgi:phytoene dehydrogenase-like protein